MQTMAWRDTTTRSGLREPAVAAAMFQAWWRLSIGLVYLLLVRLGLKGEEAFRERVLRLWFDFGVCMGKTLPATGAETKRRFM